MKTKFYLRLLIMFLFALPLVASSTTYYSRVSTGNWNTSGTWSTDPCGGAQAANGAVPTSTDDVQICTGHTITMDAAPGACNNLTINGTLTWTAVRTLDVSGNLTINNGAVLGGTGSPSSPVFTLNVAGNLTTTGSSTIRKLTLDIAGTSSISGTVTFNNKNGSKVFNGDVTINTGGSIVISASYVQLEMFNLIMNGTADISASASGIVYVYSDLTISSGASATMGDNDLDVTGITTIAGNLTFDQTASSGFKRFHSDVTINNGGSINFSSIKTLDIGDVGVPETIDLVMEGTASITGSVTGIINVSDELRFGSSPNVTIGACDLTVTGLTTTTGTVTFNSATGTKTFSGGLTISSGTLIAPPTALNVVGTFTNNGTFTHNSGTVSFSGTSSVVGSSTTTFSGFTIASGTFTAPASTMNIVGTYTNNGTFTNNSGTIAFIGSSAQALTGSSTSAFSNLTISNTAGVSLSSTTVTISDVLTLNNGTFAAAGNSITLLSSGTKTARIAPVTGTGACSGNFTIMKDIPNRAALSWANLSSPVTSTTFADWDGELFFTYTHNGSSDWANVLKYDETTADYVAVTSGTTILPGEGTEIYFADESDVTTFTGAVLSTTGTPTTGDRTINLNYTGAIAPYAGQNLIGNPFASPIDIASMTFTNTSSTIDVYDNVTNNYAPLSSGTLSAQQGFWAYALSASPTPSVTIAETDKATSMNDDIRTTDIAPFMMFTLSSADGANEWSHTFKVATAAQASNNFDIKEDHPFRRSPNKKAPYINCNSDKLPLVINTFNSMNESYTMPLSVFVGNAGKFQLSISGIEFITSDYSCVLMEDKVSGKFIDLNKISAYTFLASPNDNQNRFVLHFSKSQTCKAAELATASGIENEVQILQTINGATIHFNLDEATATSISVNNVLGQQVIAPLSITAETQSINIDIPSDFHGVYLIKIDSANGELVKKMVKP